VGNQIQGITEVVKALQGTLGPSHQIGIRGGGFSEGIGWFTAGPKGDPRVPEADSRFPRRTPLIPIFDLTSAARGLDREVVLRQIVIDASSYARNGVDAEVKAEFLKVGLGHDPSKRELNAIPALFTDVDASQGVLMVFAAAAAKGEKPYLPSHHRNDPNWGKSVRGGADESSKLAYKHAVTMEEGTRHIRAILPVLKMDGTYPEGAFAMITTPEILALSIDIQRALFDAAFRRMDRELYDAILADAVKTRFQAVA
jgi:hypothetical protein